MHGILWQLKQTLRDFVAAQRPRGRDGGQSKISKTFLGEALSNANQLRIN